MQVQTRANLVCSQPLIAIKVGVPEFGLKSDGFLEFGNGKVQKTASQVIFAPIQEGLGIVRLRGAGIGELGDVRDDRRRSAIMLRECVGPRS